MLDVSEQGLRFRATAPIKPSGPIPFSFTSHSKLVTGIGELVWIDKTKKTGGLRFTDLPYSALEQIRKLPQNTNLRPGIGNDLTLHIPAPDDFPSSRHTSHIRIQGCFRAGQATARVMDVER